MSGGIGGVSGGSGTSKSQDVGGKDNDSGAKAAEEAARRAAEEAARRAAEEAAREAARQRDQFTRQGAGRRNLVALDGGGAGQPQAQAQVPGGAQNTFRVGYNGVVQTQSVNARTTADTDAAATRYIEEQFQAKLGRPAGQPEQLLAQARASGATTLEDIQKYVDRIIDGSPEKAALNHINAEFESKLGRSLTVAEQAQWLRDSGLKIDDPAFRQKVSAQIMASEEYRAGHPDAGPAMSPEEAFILQFNDPTYNPTGPTKSSNCGPASLAMSMAYTGHMPPGLTKEQQVDYARAIMHPGVTTDDGLTYVKDANGNDVPQLNRDSEYTDDKMETSGITAAGGSPSFGQGWDELDKALENGPVLGNGYLGPAWREQFPQRVGSGDVGHVNAILGKTAEGKYIVADPMHTGGPVEMTREQLAVFFPDTNGVPTFAATGLGHNNGGVVPPSTGGSTGTGDPGSPSQATGAPAAGLSYDGGTTYNAQVEQLQRALVEAEYLTQADMDTGPGFYGNHTRDAVEQLQRDYGLPVNGASYDEATRAVLEKALAGEKPTGTGGSAPVEGTPPSSSGQSPQYTFNARSFPGFYDASKDSDKIYNVSKMVQNAPKMWSQYGDTFKKVGQELNVDPHALAAYCAFESYDSRVGTFNPNAEVSEGGMHAAGIAQTQAQNWKGKEVPGLSGVRFPSDEQGTANMLKANPEYGIRCLATIMKGQYENNGKDLAKSFPLTAFPSWGDPARRRGAYGDQATYVSRAFVFYNAFRQADGLPPAQG